MGTEDKIRELLLQGHEPRSIIRDHKFAKSTVYKVHESIRSFQDKVTPHNWVIENIMINGQTQPRVMPGDTIRINFSFRNNNNQDFYAVNLGIQPEWMVQENRWTCQSIKDLIKPGQSKFVSLSFEIPSDLSLGEYEITFGVEGQYLPVQDYGGQSLTTHWTNPTILNVKKPSKNIRIFLSHSIQDEYLVRELKNKLDVNGIEVLIGEDEVSPGAYLPDKFKQMINSCNVFIAILTNAAVESKWVRLEIDHAIQINKPRILLKDELVHLNTDYEWIEFSSSEQSDMIFAKIMTAINNVHQVNGAGGIIGGLIGVGILAVLLGALSDR